MAHDMYGTLYSNAQHVIGATSQTAAPQSEESFLRDVVTPIYEVLQKVKILLSMLLMFTYFVIISKSFILKEARRNKNGKSSHSEWRNYDDLNEYFW